MFNIISRSKFQPDYQTTIPEKIRKHYAVDTDTIVEWFINENGNPEIIFRKKVTLDDVAGWLKKRMMIVVSGILTVEFI